MKMARTQAAPMNKGRSRSGGGIRTNKKVEKPVVYGKRRLDAIDPGYADQIGQAIDPRARIPLYAGNPKDYADLGNYCATKVGVGGPGADRNVYEHGFQGLHGTVVKGEVNRSPDPPAARRVGASSDLGKDKSKWGDR
jgi:hypothetical protein